MHQRPFVFLGFAAAILASASVAAAPSLDMPSDGDQSPPVIHLPDGQDIPLPPGTHAFGPGGNPQHGLGGNAGVTRPLVPPDSKTGDTKTAPPPKSRAEVLDDLFHRLAVAGDSDEASGLALVIQHVWLQSGSDTSDLLMARAVQAAEDGHRDVAISLLDKVVQLDPSWSEAWNRRATVRFLSNDDVGSMDDISHVLKLEPRHFGALTGMATILLRAGMKKDALEVLRKAASIYPHNTDMQKLIDGLVPEVEGRGI